MAQAIKRLQKEYEQWKTKPPIPWVKVELANESDLKHWKIYMEGPENSPYSKGIFEINLNIPNEYPFKHPEVIFVTKTYHPNILQKDGSICQEVFKNWSPQLKIEEVMLIIRNMLESPSLESPLEEAVAKQLKDDKKAFNKTAQEWTAKHAKPK